MSALVSYFLLQTTWSMSCVWVSDWTCSGGDTAPTPGTCIPWFLSFQLHAGSWRISKLELTKLGCSLAVNLRLLIQVATFFSERAQFQWSMAASLWSNGILVTQEHSPPAIDSRAQTSFSSFNICITLLSVKPALINGNNIQIIAAANSWMLLAWWWNSGVREPPVGCKHHPVLPNNPQGALQ